MGKQTSPKFMLFMFALVMAAILGSAGLQGYKILSDKAKEQRTITASILRWKKSFLALSGTQERWNKTFIQTSSVVDTDTIKSMLDLNAYGLAIDNQAIGFKADQTDVTSNSIPLKLKKVCLVSTGTDFVLTAPTYEQLLAGYVKLSHRRDIFINNVSILGDKPVPEAVIADFCIYLRS